MAHYLIRWVSSGQELRAIFANWLQIDTQAHISNWRLKLELNQDGACQPYLLLDLSHFHLEATLNATNYVSKYNFVHS